MNGAQSWAVVLWTSHGGNLGYYWYELVRVPRLDLFTLILEFRFLILKFKPIRYSIEALKV